VAFFHHRPRSRLRNTADFRRNPARHAVCFLGRYTKRALGGAATMKRRYHITFPEILIAIGVTGLLGWSLYPAVTHAVFSFLHGLPWNP
jgi:hypothetical protein